MQLPGIFQSALRKVPHLQSMFVLNTGSGKVVIAGHKALLSSVLGALIAWLLLFSAFLFDRGCNDPLS